MAWSDDELLGFDLETTGTDPFSDVPVSFALVRWVGERRVGAEAALVDPGRPIPAAASAVHGISTDRARQEGMGLPAACREILAALLDAARRGVPVVGMHVCFDLTIVDQLCRRHHGRSLRQLGWQGPVLDVLTIDRHLDRHRRGSRTLGALCRHYGVVAGALHDATADVDATLAVLHRIVGCFPAVGAMSPAQLTVLQQRWHRAWAADLSRYRRRRGQPPLMTWETQWPVPTVGPDIGPRRAAPAAADRPAALA